MRIKILIFFLLLINFSCQDFDKCEERISELKAEHKSEILKLTAKIESHSLRLKNLQSFNDSINYQLKFLTPIEVIFNEDSFELAMNSSLKVSFEDINIELDNVSLLDKSKNDLLYPIDSVPVLLTNIGERIDNKTLRVKDCVWENLQVFVKYQTTASIGDEGPHLDLRDWKHFTSDWIKLERTNVNEWKIQPLTQEEQQQFPAITKTELQKAALKFGGIRWEKVVEKYTEQDLEPKFLIRIGHFMIKIQGLDKLGNPVERLLKIEYPMGC